MPDNPIRVKAILMYLEPRTDKSSALLEFQFLQTETPITSDLVDRIGEEFLFEEVDNSHPSDNVCVLYIIEVSNKQNSNKSLPFKNLKHAEDIFSTLKAVVPDSNIRLIKQTVIEETLDHKLSQKDT